MRFVPVLSLCLMTTAAAAGMTAAVPATAKEKAEAPKASYSPAFSKEAQPVQKAIAAKDWVAAKAGLEKAAPAATTPDDKFLYSYFRYQTAAGTNDTALLKDAVMGMLASGKAPADLAPKLEGMAGQYALQAGDTAGAIDHLNRAVNDPTADPQLHYLLAEAYFSSAVKNGGGKVTPQTQPDFAQGLAALQSAVDRMKAAGKPVPVSYYDRGIEIARAINSPELGKWAQGGVENGSTRAWNALLSSYQSNHKGLTRGENIDLFRLMSRAKAMQYAGEYAEYADATSKAGLIGETKAVIDEGRASGKLQPGQLADLYKLAEGEIAKDKAALPGSESAATKSPNGKLSAATGDAYLSYGDCQKASALYRQALAKGGVDANEVNTRLGIALSKCGDVAGATAAFEAVTGPGVRKDIAGFWLSYMTHKPA